MVTGYPDNQVMASFPFPGSSNRLTGSATIPKGSNWTTYETINGKGIVDYVNVSLQNYAFLSDVYQIQIRIDGNVFITYNCRPSLTLPLPAINQVYMVRNNTCPIEQFISFYILVRSYFNTSFALRFWGAGAAVQDMDASWEIYYNLLT